jgi:hypothetical protein
MGLEKRSLKLRLRAFLSLFVFSFLSYSCTFAQNSWFDFADEYKDKAARWASETLAPKASEWKKSYEYIQQNKITPAIKDSLDKLSELFKDHDKQSKDEQTEANRKFLEFLGRLKLGSGTTELNDYARDFIDKYCPALKNTGYYNNPSKAISYYLVLDPKGFIEKVRIIQGPLGVQMTIKEAYEYYTRTDPKKAKLILEMMNSLRKLHSPEDPNQQTVEIIKAIKNNIELLNTDSKPSPGQDSKPVKD